MVRVLIVAQATLMPDSRNPAKLIEHISAMVSTDPHDRGYLIVVGQLLFYQLVVVLPRATKLSQRR